MNMNTQSVCIFPDTMPRAEILFPLVQVFAPVVYLRAMENDEPAAEELSPLCREMAAEELIRFAAPAPLGPNRERFLQLVHELQTRPDDYAGQLSQLSLAGLGRRKSESRTTIIGSLLKQSGLADSGEEQRELVLWQARLVLKLGDFFDRDQEELQRNLDRISALEQGLIEELREDREQPFSLTRLLNSTGGRTDNQLRLRLKAWSRLFALGESPPGTAIFVTAGRDALELLLDRYEQDHGLMPGVDLQLLLPGGRESSDFAEQRQRFLEQSAKLQDLLAAVLEQPAAGNQEAVASLNGEESDWAALVEENFPRAKNGRCSLSLYRLPGVNAAKLFLDTFGRDEDDLQAEENPAKTDLLIGLLEEEEAS